MRQFKVSESRYIRPILSEIGKALVELIKAGTVEIRLVKESKTRDQEAKYHALIGDIAKQTSINDELHDVATWKALLIDGFENEKISCGESLRHPGRLIVSLDGERNISIRPSSVDFVKIEGSEFIEYLHMKGAEWDVKWSEKAQAHYRESVVVESLLSDYV